MSNGQVDPRWPRLLGLAVHEFRTPITVVGGYIRMLLKDRAGALNEQQRKLLEEAEKSCGRLAGLVSEMSDLASLEAGTVSLARSTVDLSATLAEAVTALPPLADREVRVELHGSDGAAKIMGDASRLRSAFVAILGSMRRELVTSDVLLVQRAVETHDGAATYVVSIGDAEGLAKIAGSRPGDLGVFDEWRGGCGLSLGIARRTLAAHGGGIWSPVDGTKSAALVRVPLLRE
jgi:K+-sensing histidine kinase KdpD